MTWGRFIIAATLVVCLASCKTLEENLIGQWVSEDQNQTVEFAADHTATFTSYGRSVEAEYKFTDKTHATFNFHAPLGELEGTQIAQVTIENNELTLDFESGLQLTYQRAKS